MKILLINNHTIHNKELVDFLPGIVSVLNREDLKNDINFSEYDLIVFSGGSDVPTAMRHPDIYSEEIEIIKNQNIPILGVCLGSEIINIAFGGTLKSLNSKIEGEYKISILNEDIRNILGDSILVQEAHGLGIDNIPECLDVVAISDYGPEILIHKERSILALQFHPEITNNIRLKEWIFKKLVK